MKYFIVFSLFITQYNYSNNLFIEKENLIFLGTMGCIVLTGSFLFFGIRKNEEKIKKQQESKELIKEKNQKNPDDTDNESGSELLSLLKKKNDTEKNLLSFSAFGWLRKWLFKK